MALYAIGDLHLSLTANKSMEVFGAGWENYTERLRQSLSQLGEEDTIVLAGDTSWGMSLEEAEADLRFLGQMPGRKILLKGNHDYWWNTVSKMRKFLEEKGIENIEFLHNNCFFYGDWAICGTRGWFWEEEQGAQDAKVLNRELGRLETSLKAAGDREKLVFLHYPPLYQGYQGRVDALHQLAVHAPHALAQPPLVERADLFEQHHAVARQAVVGRRERNMRRQLRLVRLRGDGRRDHRRAVSVAGVVLHDQHRTHAALFASDHGR